jgi:branched-chain amino acid transport system substrate-binding protein
MNIHRRALLALALATGLTAPTLALAEDTIKIGLLATFEGPFTVLGEDGQRGAQVAVD